MPAYSPIDLVRRRRSLARSKWTLSGGVPSANLLTGLGVDQFFGRSEGTTDRYFLTGALGSTVALADSTGALTTEYTYEPFGKAAASGEASSSAFQFTGRESGGATGLQYSRARYYNPSWGRFISEDPIGFAGGDSNLYSYVGNSPTNLTDPTGQVAVALVAVPAVKLLGGLLVRRAAISVGALAAAGVAGTMAGRKDAAQTRSIHAPVEIRGPYDEPHPGPQIERYNQAIRQGLAKQMHGVIPGGPGGGGPWKKGVGIVVVTGIIACLVSGGDCDLE